MAQLLSHRFKLSLYLVTVYQYRSPRSVLMCHSGTNSYFVFYFSALANGSEKQAETANIQPTVLSVFVCQVGDGTTSVVLLAGEFLKQVKPFVEEGVHPRIVIKAIRKALQLCLEKMDSLAIKVS